MAKSYIEMRDELKRLELSMFVRNIERLNRQKDSIEDRSKELHRYWRKGSALTRLETEISALENRAVQMEEELKVIQERMFKNLNLAEKKEGEIKVLKQRFRARRKA